MNEWVKVIRLKIAALWRFRIRSLKKKLERRSSQTLNKYICHDMIFDRILFENMIFWSLMHHFNVFCNNTYNFLLKQ